MIRCTAALGLETVDGGNGNDTIYAEVPAATPSSAGLALTHFDGGRYIFTTEATVAEGNGGNDFIFAVRTPRMFSSWPQRR